MNIPVADFVAVLMIFIRIISAFSTAPIFGNKALPVPARIFLSFVTAYVIFSAVGAPGYQIQFTLGWLFVNAVKEVVTGLIIGFTLHIIFFAISFAGSIICFEMGLSMAEVFNPSEGTQSNIMGEAIYIASFLIFFLINGHHYLIRGLAFSFSVMPVGNFEMNKPLYEALVKYAGMVFIIALKIASPILVSYFLIHIAEGIIAKVIPQMQVFFVTQPLKIGVGFLLLTALVPIYIYFIKYLLKSYEDSLYSLLKTMAG